MSIYSGILSSIESLCQTIDGNVDTLLLRLTAQRAIWLDNLQHVTAQRMGYLDAPISSVGGGASVQVVTGQIAPSAPSADHAISAVDLTRTFPIVTSVSNALTEPAATLRVSFINTTTLRVEKPSAGSGIFINYTIYVITI